MSEAWFTQENRKYNNNNNNKNMHKFINLAKQEGGRRDAKQNESCVRLQGRTCLLSSKQLKMVWLDSRILQRKANIFCTLYRSSPSAAAEWPRLPRGTRRQASPCKEIQYSLKNTPLS